MSHCRTPAPAFHRSVGSAALEIVGHADAPAEARRRAEVARRRDNLALYGRWRAAERLLRAWEAPPGSSH